VAISRISASDIFFAMIRLLFNKYRYSIVISQ
jgi:hypothetical protein